MGQQRGEALHGAQRCAHAVGKGAGEVLQVGHRFRQAGGAPGDRLFERRRVGLQLRRGLIQGGLDFLGPADVQIDPDRAGDLAARAADRHAARIAAASPTDARPPLQLRRLNSA